MTSSQLPNVLENIVGDYTNTDDYPNLISIDPKIHTSDKYFIKQISDVSRTDLILFNKAYKYAVEFINKYYPYNPTELTLIDEKKYLPRKIYKASNYRNFRIDPMLVFSFVMYEITANGENIESMDDTKPGENIASKLNEVIERCTTDVSEIVVMIKDGEIEDPELLARLESMKEGDVGMDENIIIGAWIECGAKTPNLYHTTYWVTMMHAMTPYIISEMDILDKLKAEQNIESKINK
jgi:hypothetical protein